MDGYEQKLKESLVTLHLNVLNEYRSICLENSIATDISSLSGDVISFINLCDQAWNYFAEKRSTLSAYNAGAFGVSGDQMTQDYLEKIEIRFDILLDKIRKSSLSDLEQSKLLANLVLNIGNYSYEHFQFIPQSQSFIAKMTSELNDDDLVSIYNKLNGCKYVYVDSIKRVVDSRGIEVAKPESSGCYVATCVYGSYDCPQVWTLRRFRDNTLAETFFGRLFIKLYYAISPTAVKLFGNRIWFHKLFKAPLDKLVEKLQNNGVEDTPYFD